MSNIRQRYSADSAIGPTLPVGHGPLPPSGDLGEPEDALDLLLLLLDEILALEDEEGLRRADKLGGLGWLGVLILL